MAIFDAVRNLLSQGDTAQALRLLITHLEKEKGNSEALRILRVVEANYNSARNKELKGLIDFSEAQQAYNKINDALLGVTDDLMAGRKPSLEMERETNGSNRIFWLIGASVLVLLAVIVFILLKNNSGSEGAKETVDCPKFDQASFSVLLIPFQNLGEGASKPELALQTRIRDLTGRNNMRSDVQIFPGNRFKDSTPGLNEASEEGNHCGAKMVIWGQYEKVDSGISLDVRYVFTQKPNLPAGAISETLRNISELKNDNLKFSSLEQAVFSLCSKLALHEGRVDLAEKWLGKLEAPSATEQQLQEILKSK